MQRRNFLRNSSFAFGALSLTSKNLFASIFQQDPWKMKIIRNDVGVFTEKGGTIGYLLSKKGIAVIDAEFPDQASHLITELKKISDKPFELLINTHHHFDHTSGNIAFKGLVKNVAAHENSLANQRRVAEQQKNEDKQLYPDITYVDSQTFKVGKERLKTYYYGAAHTNGDSIIHLENANIAHMGDLVFNRKWAFIDRSAGASIKSWISVLDKALKTFDNETVFIFGHAFDPEKVTGNKEDLKAMQDYLTKLLDFVGKEIKDGKPKEEVLKEKAIPGVTKWQGEGIERGLQAAYEELTTQTN
ncbi:MAG: MBL fold metallo-hydrolase [Bacteroidetes bacterium]|nr:MBL fold metallo-hydrolase [Bacteroidota bacterium]MBS1973519.1 MBL fold metallo-hydrolase [Bacteroidota bacterium]